MTIKPTKDADGKPNGWIGLIWRRDEQPELAPDQVYVTAIAPGCCKGPHAHRSRSVFQVISGDVLIVARFAMGSVGRLEFCYYTSNKEIADRLGVATHSGKVVVEQPDDLPTSSSAAIYNVGKTEALVLNLKSPAWSPDDDLPVENWQHPSWWKPKSEYAPTEESFGVCLL